MTRMLGQGLGQGANNHLHPCHAAFKMVPMGFCAASSVAQQRGEIVCVTTGCKELDSILEGAVALHALSSCACHISASHQHHT